MAVVNQGRAQLQLFPGIHILPKHSNNRPSYIQPDLSYLTIACCLAPGPIISTTCLENSPGMPQSFACSDPVTPRSLGIAFLLGRLRCASTWRKAGRCVATVYGCITITLCVLRKGLMRELGWRRTYRRKVRRGTLRYSYGL